MVVGLVMVVVGLVGEGGCGCVGEGGSGGARCWVMLMVFLVWV